MRIYSARNVFIGLIIFLGLVTFPFYYGLATGKAAFRPEPKKAAIELSIEPVPYKRAKHQDMLSKWKHLAVREGKRTYIASDGREYTISFPGTCMLCHESRAQFCDQCHDYVGVRPNCWNCHGP